MNIFKRDSLTYILIVLGIAILIVAPKGYAVTYTATGNPGDNVSGEVYTEYGTDETINYVDGLNNSKPTTYPADNVTFTVSPEHGFSQNIGSLDQQVTPGDIITHETYWVTNEGNVVIPLTRYFYSEMSNSPGITAEGWTVEAYEDTALLFTLVDRTISTSQDVIADNSDKQNHYVVYVNPETDKAPDGSYINIYTTWESSATYAGQYTGGNALTYSGTTSAFDDFTDDTEAPVLTLTRVATIDAPRSTVGYDGGHEDAVPGAIITFTMTYSNEGGASAESVVLIDRVPDNTKLTCINTGNPDGSTTYVDIINGPQGNATGWSVYYFDQTDLYEADKTYGAVANWKIIGIITTAATDYFPGGGTTWGSGEATYDDATFVKWEKDQIAVDDDTKTLSWGVSIR